MTIRRSRGGDADRDRAPRGSAGRVVRVGNYIVERRLGSGGQADVFLARDVVLRRLVALKVLHRTSEPAQNVRGLEEARLIATLDHPNIVRVYHVELAEGVWYMAMEYVDGGNLELRVWRLGPLDPVRALGYAAVVADALQHAHAIGVVHRDVKPQNLLETRAGVVKLADFGLAGLRHDALDAAAGTKQTRAVGTPQYLAPEMWLGEPATPRADLYGLGATLHFMLTGRPPFLGKTVRELRTAHLTQTPVLPPDVPRPAGDVVLHCLAKNPLERPASAQALAEELQHAIGTLTGDRRRRQGTRRAVGEPSAYAHGNRVSADAAVLRLPAFAEAREKLEEVLDATPSLVVVHGPEQDVRARVVRAVLDGGEPRRYYLAARAILGSSVASLGALLMEQLHLGGQPAPGWHDRVIAELQPEAGAGAALPSVMELDLQRPLTSVEATDLVELGRRAEGKAIVFLLTGEDAPAQALLTDVEAAGFGFLVRRYGITELNATERAEYVRVWTHHATGDRLRWTDDALRLLRAIGRRRPVGRLVHNGIMLAQASGMRMLTTWSVLGADAHADYIHGTHDITPDWRNRPARWPAPDVLETLIQLRAQSPERRGGSR